MRNARWPSARKFLCAGRAGFPEILQIFRAIFAQNLRHLDAGLAHYLALERTPTRNRAATKFCSSRRTSRNHAGRVHATFLRAVHQYFSETLKFLSREFNRIRRKICVIPTPDAFFFGSECNYDSINSQRRCGVCTAHAGRVHAIFLRGACRTSGNFEKISRDFCAIFVKFAPSRRWTRALSCIRTHADSEKSCNEVLRFAQPRWPSSRSFSARGAPKFF